MTVPVTSSSLAPTYLNMADGGQKEMCKLCSCSDRRLGYSLMRPSGLCAADSAAVLSISCNQVVTV